MWERGERRENKLYVGEEKRENKFCGRGKDVRTHYVGEGKAREQIMWERGERRESKLCGRGGKGVRANLCWR